MSRHLAAMPSRLLSALGAAALLALAACSQLAGADKAADLEMALRRRDWEASDAWASYLDAVVVLAASGPGERLSRRCGARGTRARARGRCTLDLAPTP